MKSDFYTDKLTIKIYYNYCIYFFFNVGYGTFYNCSGESSNNYEQAPQDYKWIFHKLSYHSGYYINFVLRAFTNFTNNIISVFIFNKLSNITCS